MPKPNHYVIGATMLSASDSDCDVIASGGYFPIQLPSPSMVPDGCDITVVNADGGSGKSLVNFPADVNPRLYPKQSVSVTTQNGQWISTATPGRFRINASCYTVYVADAAHGGNDANDGLSPATPLLKNGTATQMIYKDFDCQNITPIHALVAGSSFNNDPIALGGQLTGDNLYQVSVYGNGQAQILCDHGPPISVGDNAELNLAVGALCQAASIYLQGNKNNLLGTACGIYQHNNGLFDMSGNVYIQGNGNNDCAFFFDGPTPGASIADGFYVGGTFGDIWHMDEGGGRYTLSGNIAPYTTCSAARLLWIGGENELIMGGPSPVSNYVSIGPSLVTDAGLLITNGVVIPGGVTTANNGRVQTVK